MEARYSTKVQRSGRTTAQVIVEKELELYSHIIGPDTVTEHGESCRCQSCWHRFCDSVIKAGEEALNETNIAPSMADIGLSVAPIVTVFNDTSLAR